MLRCMDSAVAGLKAHQNKMDVVGNNIANVNTVGYKAQTYTFKDAMYQTSSASTGGTKTAGGTNAAQYGYGALMGSIGMDMTASTPFFASGLTACINGEGFFLTCATKTTVATPDSGEDPANVKGSKQDWDYTRVGDFMIDSQGYLTDTNGNYVYGFQAKGNDANGVMQYSKKLTPLRVPKSLAENTTGGGFTGTYSDDLNDCGIATNVSINSLGEITATVKILGKAAAGGNPATDDQIYAGISLGKVAIVTFQNPNGLTKGGGNYFKATDTDNTGAGVAAEPGSTGVADLMTGYLEASNVDLAQEFSNMITTHRGYQANTKMITVSDEMLSDLVSMKR